MGRHAHMISDHNHKYKTLSSNKTYKMLYKFVLVFVFFMVLADFGPVQSRTTFEPVFAFEEHCVRQGGICLKEENCDPSNIVSIGTTTLCPAQMHLGAVCCYL